MKCTFLILLLVSLTSYRALAQDADYRKNAISFTPSSIIHLSGKPGLEFGYERFLHERISLNTEFTYVKDFFDTYDMFDLSEKFRGFATGASIRFYSKSFNFLPLLDVNANEGFRLFISPGFYYGRNSRIQTNEFYAADSSIYMDEYRIVRNEKAFYLDLGLKDTYGRWSLEMVGGFGYIFRNTTHFDRENLNDVSSMADGEYFLFEHEPAQQYTLGLIRIKFAISYAF
jgi:hypothetical protein